MTKVPLNSLKPGDKFTVEATVTSKPHDDVLFRLEGSNYINSVPYYRNRFLVTKIVPPKTTVEVGDAFKSKTGYIFTIIGLDEDQAWYKYQCHRRWTRSSGFRDQFLSDLYTFLGNANDQGVSPLEGA